MIYNKKNEFLGCFTPAVPIHRGHLSYFVYTCKNFSYIYKNIFKCPQA